MANTWNEYDELLCNPVTEIVPDAAVLTYPEILPTVEIAVYLVIVLPPVQEGAV